MSQHRVRLKNLTCAIAITALTVAAAFAQESTPPNTLSLVGRGKVKVRPTMLELSGTLSVEAELSGDALTKFRTAKQAINESIPKLGITNLTMEMTGFSIGPAGPTD